MGNTASALEPSTKSQKADDNRERNNNARDNIQTIQEIEIGMDQETIGSLSIPL